MNKYILKINNKLYKKILLSQNLFDLKYLRLKLLIIDYLIKNGCKTINDINNKFIKDIHTIYFKKSYNLNKKNQIIHYCYQEDLINDNIFFKKSNKKKALLTRDLNINILDKIYDFDLIIAETESENGHTAIIAKECKIPFILGASGIKNIKHLSNIKINYDKKEIKILK